MSVKRLRYRMYNFWISLGLGKDSGEFGEWKVFEEWALRSGYRHWKILKLRDENGGFNRTNCYWGFDKRIRGRDKPITKESTDIESCRLVKNLAYGVNELRERALELSEIATQLEIPDSIPNKKLSRDIQRSLKEVRRLIDVVANEVDTIELMEVQ